MIVSYKARTVVRCNAVVEGLIFFDVVVFAVGASSLFPLLVQSFFKTLAVDFKAALLSDLFG